MSKKLPYAGTKVDPEDTKANINKLLMSAEERALRAIEVTRSTLIRALNDPEVLMMMVAHEVDPQDVETMVEDILEYLEKTA